MTRVHDGTVEIIARDVEEMCYSIMLSSRESIDWNSVHLDWNGWTWGKIAWVSDLTWNGAQWLGKLLWNRADWLAGIVWNLPQ